MMHEGDALIGSTGFVGATLQRSRTFDATFNSANIDTIAGRRFRLLVCAGAPAEKWKANADPDADWANLRRLLACLDRIEAERVVLISTVDVYPSPVDVDEDTRIDATGQPYGRHRLALEEFIRRRFASTVVRLPALHGPGLKKNALYDMLHGRLVDRIDARGVFQFYDMNRLARDLDTAMDHGLALVNLVTEPVDIREIAMRSFGLTLSHEPAGPPPRYDVRTRHAETFGGQGGYIEHRDMVLDRIERFVADAQAAR